MGKYPYFPNVETNWNKKQQFDSISIKAVTTPSNPEADYYKLYFKSDGKLYKLDSSGNETVSNVTVSSATQTLLDAKANLASPTFTGVVTIPNVANLETAVVANTAKTGITGGQASAITANTAKTGITAGQASAITANTAKTGITAGQASAITANTAKTGITAGQASAITANTAKTGITAGQASAITANTAKVSLDDNSVTLAKLAHGTADKYLGFDGSGNPAELTVSAGGGQINDKVLTTDGSLGNYTAVTSVVVSSDPANDAVLSGQSVSRTGWSYPSASSMLSVIDGNDATTANFDMGTATNATCVVDFGSSKTESIYAKFRANATPTVLFESSTDGASWTTRATQVVADSSTTYTLNVGTTTFRYLRLRNTNSSGYAWHRINTIGISGYGATNLTDGSSSTNWYSSSESDPYVYFDLGSNLELQGLAINLNRTATTVTNLTIDYSTDTTFSGETVRTLAVSDFTDDTTRFINIPRQEADARYVRIKGVGTGVLSLNYLKYKTVLDSVWSRKHFHNYLNPALTTANTMDSN